MSAIGPKELKHTLLISSTLHLGKRDLPARCPLSLVTYSTLTCLKSYKLTDASPTRQLARQPRRLADNILVLFVPQSWSVTTKSQLNYKPSLPRCCHQLASHVDFTTSNKEKSPHNELINVVISSIRGKLYGQSKYTSFFLIFQLEDERNSRSLTHSSSL